MRDESFGSVAFEERIGITVNEFIVVVFELR